MAKNTDMKKKVIIVFGAEFSGGVRNYVLYIAKKLPSSRFIITYSDFKPSEKRIDNIFYLRRQNLLYLFFSIYKLKQKFQVSFFAHTIRGGANAYLFAKLLRIDYVYVGHTIRSSQLNCGFKKTIIKIIEKVVLGNSKFNIAICIEEHQELIDRDFRSILIPSFFDFTRHNQSNNFLAGKVKVFYNLASVELRKNPYLFIEIAKKFKYRSDIHFKWFGSGPMLDKVRNLIQKEQLNNVYFEGYVSNATIHEKINQFYALLLTSEVEGVPVSILESLNYGKPVVVHRYSGCNPANIINHSENGFIFNSVSEAVCYINQLLDADFYNGIILNLEKDKILTKKRANFFINQYRHILIN